MFLATEQVIPDAAHCVVPAVNVAPVGETRTSWYAIGQKSSGNEGNWGAEINAPTVVVTQISVGTIEPCAHLIAPASFTPHTKTFA